jgi:hypothetical protein
MRDLRSNELTHVYGAGGSSKSCYTPPKCAPKASKSKKSKGCKAKASKSKKGWC